MVTAAPGIAVLGCGRWGINHVRLWHEFGCLRVACDVDPLRLEQVRARHPGVETATETTAVLARPDVAAVVIATPPRTHAPLALAAMEAGKDVLVEKPLALTSKEGEKVVETASRLSRVLAVGHVLEYHPGIRKLRELISERTLGRIRYIYANRVNLGRIRTEENALWSFAPHDVAIMLRLIGSPPQQVGCEGAAYLNRDVADFTLTSLRFPNDVLGHIFVSWLHPFKEHRLVVVGDRQMAVFEDTAPWDQKLVVYPHEVAWPDLGLRPAREAETVAMAPGRAGVAAAVLTALPEVQKAQGVPADVERAEPLQIECMDFKRCIATRERPLADGESALEVLRVLEAAQRSLDEGGIPQRYAGASAERFSVHPSAVVDPGAVIGDRTRVWHFSHVMPRAVIGSDCVLGQNVFVGRGVRIGSGVKIQNNVSVYEGVELEDHVFCGPSVVFTNVLEPRSEIDRRDEFRRTLVRRGATLGANSTILCGLTIGRHAFVGAGAVVTADVPDYALVLGVPARIKGWVCECGARLRFADQRAACPTCDRRYRRASGRGAEREL